MNTQTLELSEKIRRQFDNAPYPNIPLEINPKNNHFLLYLHSLVTPYYLRHQKVVDTNGKVILDAGCGSGYKSLVLAMANPGAKIVGVDLSAESVHLAAQRLQYYGFENAEFHAITIEELPSLGIKFDYINCDEVLYLLPDPVVGLQAMQAVLSPEGIIRANFHSSLQRFIFLAAQKFFTLTGVTEDPDLKSQVAAVREVMAAIKPGVGLKNASWTKPFEEDDERVLANHLLQGDKGWIIPDFFAALRAANLEFVSMTDWRNWDLLDLFDSVEDLPISVAMTIAESPIEDQLHMYELLHPVKRLLDLWCAHPSTAHPYLPIAEWSDQQWQSARILLHPQVNTPEMKQELIDCLNQSRMFEMSKYIKLGEEFVTIDGIMAGCILPLTNGSQTIQQLVARWQQLRPIHPVTLQPTEAAEAFELVKQLLLKLEQSGYVLMEQD
jgi:2-polyprenyl-3-methyl-5-hydroxy-6-metoxy-1,4-benzoquinol methylase